MSQLTGSSSSWSWKKHLQAASFRGVPFAVIGSDGQFGRRVAVHEYPFRDTVWIEDLGRSSRKITLQGFLIQDPAYATSNDVFTQRDSLVSACETSGSGTLIHPTLGSLTVSIPAGGLKIKEHRDHGRVFEFTLTCLESGLKVFALTSATSSVSSSLKSSWLSTAIATVAKFISTISGAIRSVTQAIKTIKSTITYWKTMVTSVVTQANNLTSTLESTFGSTKYGRYCTGSVGGSVSGATGTTDTTDDTDDYDTLVAEKLASAVETQAAITTALDALDDVTTVAGFTTAVQDVIEAILASDVSAATIMTMLESISGFSDSTYRTDTDATVASAVAVFVNSMTAAAMAYAAVNSNPSSYDEAMDLMSRTRDVLDTSALEVADAGWDEVYTDLQAMRTDVVSLFEALGADLAQLTTVTYNDTMPALTVANDLYQDAARAESLVKSADPIHPAFMPSSFEALSE